MDADAEIKLTRKQRVFIDEYLLSFNATQAALRAGYSAKTAYSIGFENLRKPEISAEIKRRLDARAVSAEEALDIISKQARADMGAFMDADGAIRLDPATAKAQGLTKLLKKVKQKTTLIRGREDEPDREVRELEIELYDAQAAADKILRVHGKYQNPETDNRFTLIIRREDT